MDKKEDVLIKHRNFNYQGRTIHVVANFNRLEEGFDDVLKKHDHYVCKNLSDITNSNIQSIFFVIEAKVYVVVLNDTIEEKIKQLIEKYNVH